MCRGTCIRIMKDSSDTDGVFNNCLSMISLIPATKVIYIYKKTTLRKTPPFVDNSSRRRQKKKDLDFRELKMDIRVGVVPEILVKNLTRLPLTESLYGENNSKTTSKEPDQNS